MRHDNPDKLNNVAATIEHLDGTGSVRERAAISILRQFYGTDLPTHLFDLYKRSKRKGVRAACLYYCFRDAKNSSPAQDMALAALCDKSKQVRYRACQLLAYSLNKSLMPRLESHRNTIAANSLDDLDAALDAIAHQNQHYFRDREHSGKIFMELLEQSMQDQ
jgi:hypothetical protein